MKGQMVDRPCSEEKIPARFYSYFSPLLLTVYDLDESLLVFNTNIENKNPQVNKNMWRKGKQPLLFLRVLSINSRKTDARTDRVIDTYKDAHIYTQKDAKTNRQI